MTTNSNKGIFFILVSAAAFGLMPIFAKLAYEEMSFAPTVEVKTLLAIRFSLAAICMWLLWAWQRRAGAEAAIPLRAATIIPLVVMGAIGYVGQSFSYFTAASIMSASATGLLLYTYPILVTVMSRIFFGEAITPRKIAALLIATLGALMVLGVVGGLIGISSNTIGTIDPAGATWGVAAAVIYSVYIIAGTRFTAGIPPIFASAVIITAAAVVYTVWGVIEGELRLDISPLVWFWGACIALICTVLAIAAFFSGLSLVGPSRAAIGSTLEPATTVLLAALILQENITIEQMAGGALILCSVLILQWPGATEKTTGSSFSGPKEAI